MAKRVNYQKLRMHRYYKSAELAQLFEISRSAVKYWTAHGLSPINPGSRRRLYYGKDVSNYLEERKKQKKSKNGPGEVYCLGCRTNRRLKCESIWLEYSGKILGDGTSSQVYIHGIGETCNHNCVGLSSTRCIDEFLSYYPGLKEEKIIKQVT